MSPHILSLLMGCWHRGQGPLASAGCSSGALDASCMLKFVSAGVAAPAPQSRCTRSALPSSPAPRTCHQRRERQREKVGAVHPRTPRRMLSATAPHELGLAQPKQGGGRVVEYQFATHCHACHAACLQHAMQPACSMPCVHRLRAFMAFLHAFIACLHALHCMQRSRASPSSGCRSSSNVTSPWT